MTASNISKNNFYFLIDFNIIYDIFNIIKVK